MSEAGRSPAASAVDVRLAGDADSRLLADFYRRVWDPGASAEGVLAARRAQAAANRAEPGVPNPTFIFVKQGAVIGHVSTIPLTLWWRGRELPAYWVKGLEVLPEHRNGPVGFLLLKEAVARLGIAISIAAATPALRLLTAHKFRDLGPLENRLLVLRGENILRRLDLAAVGGGSLPGWAPGLLASLQRSGLAWPLGLAAGAALRAAAALRAPRPAPVETGGEPADSEIDDLWRTVRPTFGVAAVRDAQALRAAYAGEAYRTLGVRRGGALRAVVVVRAPSEQGDERLSGIRVATLSDLVCDPTDAELLAASVSAARGEALRLGADALLCSATATPLTGLLGRLGFLPVPANLHVLVRGLPEPDGPEPIGDWWVMRGDSKADEVF